MLVRLHYENGINEKITNVESIINNDKRNEVLYVIEDKKPIIKDKSRIKQVSVFEE